MTTAAVAVAAATALTVPSAPAVAAERPIMVGAVGLSGDVSALSRTLGAPLAWHAYSKLNGSVPKAPFINMKSTVKWRDVAAARPGSSTYDHIVRWARAIKPRTGPVLFAFHHEPEASTRSGMGTNKDYIAAYRRVVDIFRSQGVRNVEYTWQMTSWAFRTSPTDARYAAKWYPGDAYVDNVGVDPYNWYDCGVGQGRWLELKTVMDASLQFARKKDKQLVVAEFASDADWRRAKWIRNATAYFIANRDTVRGVFYFQYAARPGCSWKLKTAADLDAYGDMARNSKYFSGR